MVFPKRQVRNGSCQQENLTNGGQIYEQNN